MKVYPSYIRKILEHFKKLPGVGSRTAERYALNLLSWNKSERVQFLKDLENFHQSSALCPTCGFLVDNNICLFCDRPHRIQEKLCVVSHIKDVISIENTHEYKGLYHILGGHISPLEGMYAENLRITTLLQRIKKGSLQEIILALDSTFEGDATANYIREQLESHSVVVSRLAFGIPMGSALEYLDTHTISQSFCGRKQF